MMYVDALMLTVRDEDGVIMTRHFSAVYVKIGASDMTVSNKTKDIVTYKLNDVLYMQTYGHPRNFRMFQ